jgi:antitoxin VapB
MPEKATAKLFMNGRSQAVRLPKEFRFDGKEVRISRLPDGGVLLEPESKAVDVDRWLAEIWKHRPKDFMKGGRKQPRAPKRKIFE